jgi:hypothetical protein
MGGATWELNGNMMGTTWEPNGNMMGKIWEPSHWLHEALYFQNCLSPFLAWANAKGHTTSETFYI